MRTHLGPSKLANDTEDAFQLEYSHFNDFKRGGLTGAYLRTMFDEVGKVGPSLYLGIGRIGFTEKARSDLHPLHPRGPGRPIRHLSRLATRAEMLVVDVIGIHTRSEPHGEGLCFAYLQHAAHRGSASRR